MAWSILAETVASMSPPTDLARVADVKSPSDRLKFRFPSEPDEKAPISVSATVAPVLVRVPFTMPLFSRSEICSASIQSPLNPFTVR